MFPVVKASVTTFFRIITVSDFSKYIILNNFMIPSSSMLFATMNSYNFIIRLHIISYLNFAISLFTIICIQV
jgi:hypothetical protein